VESWLKMNVGMIEMTIKTMEMQKAAFETLRESARQSGTAGQQEKGNKSGK